MKVTAKITDPQAIDAAITKHYQQKDESQGINELINEIQQDGFLAEFEGRNASIDLDELKELSESNPVKKLLNPCADASDTRQGVGHSFRAV